MLGKKPDQDPAPSGLLTTMFTDIVGSTQLKSMVQGETSARRDAAFRADIKAPHDALILGCVQEFSGYVLNSTGDGYCVTFVDAEEGVLCALQIQERLRLQPILTPLGPLQVRIGLHTGMAGATSDYTATTLDKTARVQGQALGGQVVVSRETHALVAGKLHGITFEHAGTFDLKGLGADGLYRVALISAQLPAQDGEAARTAPLRQRQPEQPQTKRRPFLWLIAALALLLLGISGFLLRSRWVPQAAPILPMGSVWAGSFHFLPPIQSYTGSAHLTITQRSGDQFKGIYATEDDKYEWQVAGTVHNNRLRWEFAKTLKNPGSNDMVGAAYIEGTVTGNQITGLFHEYNSPGEVAALQMRRQD